MKLISTFRPLKRAVFNSIGIGGNGKDLRIRDTDRFIAGYPKSGNTWLDFLVAATLSSDPEKINFESIGEYVIDVHSVKPLSLFHRANPRTFKTHFPYFPQCNSAIHIVRHPYRVAVSYYYFLMKLNKFDEAYTLSEFVADWVEGQWAPQYATWGEHTKSWLTNYDNAKICMVKYERLVSDTYLELEKVLNHLNIEATSEKIELAIKWCSAENMAKLEGAGITHKNKHFTEARSDIDFVRTVSSKPRVSLKDRDKMLIASAWEREMKSLEYEV